MGTKEKTVPEFVGTFHEQREAAIKAYLAGTVHAEEAEARERDEQAAFWSNAGVDLEKYDAFLDQRPAVSAPSGPILLNAPGGGAPTPLLSVAHVMPPDKKSPPRSTVPRGATGLQPVHAEAFTRADAAAGKWEGDTFDETEDTTLGTLSCRELFLDVRGRSRGRRREDWAYMSWFYQYNPSETGVYSIIPTCLLNGRVVAAPTPSVWYIHNSKVYITSMLRVFRLLTDDAPYETNPILRAWQGEDHGDFSYQYADQNKTVAAPFHMTGGDTWTVEHTVEFYVAAKGKNSWAMIDFDTGPYYRFCQLPVAVMKEDWE